MNRIELIQKIIKTKNSPQYVEIGVYRGTSFLPIKCINKIAVDPEIKINWKGKIANVIKNYYNYNNKYFELTSDHFFETKATRLFKNKKVDVFLIDGLHTFEASLTDVLNSLRYLEQDGLIIMHDCFPPNIASSTPASSFSEVKGKNIEGWTGQWCGDVWKTIVYLKENYEEILDVCVLNTDFGLGIIKFKEYGKIQLEINEKLFNRINQIKFEMAQQDSYNVLNLRNESYAFTSGWIINE